MTNNHHWTSNIYMYVVIERKYARLSFHLGNEGGGGTNRASLSPTPTSTTAPSEEINTYYAYYEFFGSFSKQQVYCNK